MKTFSLCWLLIQENRKIGIRFFRTAQAGYIINERGSGHPAFVQSLAEPVIEGVMIMAV
jgi:hypothetical protein